MYASPPLLNPQKELTQITQVGIRKGGGVEKEKDREKEKSNYLRIREVFLSPPPFSSSAQYVYTTEAKYVTVWLD